MVSCRNAHLQNQYSFLQRYYDQLPIRKRYIRAIKRGTLVMDRGQVRIPKLGMEGLKPGEYKGKFEHLRSKKVWYHD